MNARFTILWNDDDVTITLRPGQTVKVSSYWRHDEGWALQSLEFHFDGFKVTRIDESDGTDCDGRMSTSSRAVCAISDLRAHHYLDRNSAEKWNWRSVGGLPKWQPVSAGQRDYAAEAAGY